jgi:tetratricopeptide (TPR) repeat protein
VVHVAPAAAPVATPPPDLGRVQPEGYEILQVLGRGGMGVVYKARQVRLGRVVALKMIRADLSGAAEERARFKAEAEAAARLQHPNIVQLYEVGERDGVPYLALEFVDGGSLAERLCGIPLAPREAASLIAVLAQAVHHAHERGVLHRDLKPANILLSGAWRVVRGEQETSSLVTGHAPLATLAKITDFGIAKCLDSAPGGACQTRTGEILGTPSYMAPEQAAGKGKTLGPACDVYSLGAILYELLTGRPPFVGPTPMEAVMQLVSEEPVPPRRLQRTVPRDLETICLQCLHKQPERRYRSARHLAEDCAAFLSGEPIRARAASVWERGLKWARRRPAGAGLVAVSVLALVTVLFGGWWYNGLLREERDEADQQRLQALEARERERQARAHEEEARRLAENNQREAQRQGLKALVRQKEAAEQRDKARAWFKQAREAVDMMLSRVGHQVLPPTPQTAQVRRVLLEDALRFYQGFLKEDGTDPVVRQEAVRAYWRVGDIRQTLGEPGRAEEAYRRAAELQERLAADFPDQPDHAFHVGELWINQGGCLGTLGRQADSEAAYRRALAVLGPLVKRFPDNSSYRRRLALAWSSLGMQLLAAGQMAEAESSSRQGLDLRAQLVREAPTNALFRNDLTQSQNNLSVLLLRAKRPQEAEEFARLAAEFNRELVARTPTLANRQALAHSLNNWGDALQGQGKPAEAEKLMREGLEVRRGLARDFPLFAVCRTELAQSLNHLGVQLAAARPAEAEALHREGVAVLQKLAAEFPQLPVHRSELGGALHNLAMLRRANAAEAREMLLQAIAHQRAALAANPKHAVYRRYLRNHYWMLADIHLAVGAHADAAAAARKMTEVFPESWSDLYRAAVQTARCIPIVEQDASLDPARRRKLVEEYAVQAVGQLRQAIARGMRRSGPLADVPELAPLRGRKDFQRLVPRLEI